MKQAEEFARSIRTIIEEHFASRDVDVVVEQNRSGDWTKFTVRNDATGYVTRLNYRDGVWSPPNHHDQLRAYLDRSYDDHMDWLRSKSQ